MHTTTAAPLVSARTAIWLPVMMLAFAAALVVAVLMSRELPMLISCAAMTVFAIGSLVSNALEVHTGEVRIKSPLGIVVRRYPFIRPGDLRVEGRRLLHTSTGKHISTWSLRGTDRERLFAFVTGVPIDGHAIDAGAYDHALRAAGAERAYVEDPHSSLVTEPLRARAATWVALPAFGAAAALTVVGIAIGNMILPIVAVLLIIIGVARLAMPMIEVVDGEVRQMSIFGPVIRKFASTNRADWQATPGRLTHVPTGSTISLIGLHGDDRRALVSILQSW